MGGFFGAISRRDCVMDVFFGVDYHSHLGTRRGGMAVYSPETGFQRQIHSIENTPFRTKFESDLRKFRGTSGIGCISDTDPQPLLVRSHLGLYAISTVGRINNAEALAEAYFSAGGRQLMAMSSGAVNASELTAALINEEASFADGIRRAQERIDGSLSILILTPDALIAARDRNRRPEPVGSHIPLRISFDRASRPDAPRQRHRSASPTRRRPCLRTSTVPITTIPPLTAG